MKTSGILTIVPLLGMFLTASCSGPKEANPGDYPRAEEAVGPHSVLFITGNTDPEEKAELYKATMEKGDIHLAKLRDLDPEDHLGSCLCRFSQDVLGVEGDGLCELNVDTGEVRKLGLHGFSEVLCISEKAILYPLYDISISSSHYFLARYDRETGEQSLVTDKPFLKSLPNPHDPKNFFYFCVEDGDGVQVLKYGLDTGTLETCARINRIPIDVQILPSEEHTIVYSCRRDEGLVNMSKLPRGDALTHEEHFSLHILDLETGEDRSILDSGKKLISMVCAAPPENGLPSLG